MDNTDIIAFCNELDANDPTNIQARATSSDRTWDSFCRGNFIECVRPIERKSFLFPFGFARRGTDTEILRFSGTLLGEVDMQGNMHVSFPCESFRDVSKSFLFSEISESGNRIMWSKDLENTKGFNGEFRVPDLMSLFYKNGNLLRIYLKIDNPGMRVDLWAPSISTDRKPVDEYQLLTFLSAGIQAKRDGDYQHAIEYYTQAVKLAPHDARAYINASKILIGCGKYQDAIQFLLMKVKLGIYYTKCSPECSTIERMIQLKHMEMMADAKGKFSTGISVGNIKFPDYCVPRLMEKHSICFDIAKLMWAEEDVYFYIGHSYIRLFPELFSSYCLPSANILALENKLMGRGSAIDDLRNSEQFAPLFYVVGFLVCVANISAVLPNDGEAAVCQSYKEPLCLDLTTVSRL